MAPLLLTPEQARRNLELFHHEGGKKIKGKAEDDLLPGSASIGEAISRASALNLPGRTSPPPSNVETFLNPKLHVDVLSTFLATAMVSVDYIPNATGDAAAEAKGFGELLSALLGFGSYMPLVHSPKQEFSYDGNGDCNALLKEIASFVGDSGIEEPTIVIRQLLIQASSLTSMKETQTMFVGYHFVGAESNPALYIFHGVAKMLRTDLGKSMATADQSILLRSYKYEILSNLVSKMADQLAITVVPAETLTKTINELFLLPTN